MSKLKIKTLPAKVSVAGLFVGLVLSSSALAVQSPATGTVVGHAPVLTGDAGGEIVIDDVNHNGVIDAGDKLTVNGNKLHFTDADGDKDLGYTYKWTINGTEVTKAEAANPVYTIKPGDLGKKIKLSIVGYSDSAITDPNLSAAYDSKFIANAAVGITGAVSEITVAKSTAVVSVTLTGLNAANAPVVSTALGAEAKLADGSTGVAANLTYQWQIEDAIGSGHYTNIAGPAGTAATYMPLKGDQRKHIRVDVTAKTTP
jgi:hypothetical protein